MLTCLSSTYPEVKRIELVFVRPTIRRHIADVYDAINAVGVNIISGENITTISTPLQMTKKVFLTRVLHICSQCDLCCLVVTRCDAGCFLLCIRRRVFSLASHRQDRVILQQESLIAPIATSDEPKTKECLCWIIGDPRTPRRIVDNGTELLLEQNLCSGLDDRMNSVEQSIVVTINITTSW